MNPWHQSGLSVYQGGGPPWSRINIRRKTLWGDILLEAGLAPPVGVLPAVDEEHLPRHPAVCHRPPVGLQHVIGRLAAVEAQTGDVAAVVLVKRHPDLRIKAPPTFTHLSTGYSRILRWLNSPFLSVTTV